MNFTELVMNARPSLKENSAKAYATSLKLLAPEGASSLDFLLDPEPILQKLEKYKHTTRRNYLNAVIVVLNGVEGSEGPLKEYEKVRDKYNEEYADQVQTHKKTDRQKEIWIDWPDYLGIVDRLGAEVERFKPGEWTKKQKQQYQDYLLTLLYSKYPLRNDWVDVRVITKTEYNKLSDEQKKAGNFLVKHNTNKYFFVLNEYKTSKKYGEKNIEIDPDVLRPLRKWLRHNQTGYLLINTKDQPLNSNGITKTLNRIGLSEHGKPFGSSILRHSYLSHKYVDSQQEKEKDEEEERRR
eukprot:COSAG06_NODE_10783_length_1617_cov_1.291173_3_plen_295_part_01